MSLRCSEWALCVRKHGASGPLIHQGSSKGLSDPRWQRAGVVLATKAGWGCAPHVFFRGGRLSGLVGARWLAGSVARLAGQLGGLSN